MQHDPIIDPEAAPRGVASPTPTGYEVPEGPGELVNRNFLMLFLGQTGSLVGDAFYQQTVVTWLTGLLIVGTTAAAGSLAVASAQLGLSIAIYLALVLINPFAGVFVDRWNRKTTMIVTNLVQVLLSLLPLGAFYTTSRSTFLATIYVTYFLLTLSAGVFSAAEVGTVQVIVSRRKLPQALAAFQFITAVGSILGTLFAPRVFVAYGAAAAIIVNALSFLVSAIFLCFLWAPKEALHPSVFQPVGVPERAGMMASLLRVFTELGAGIRFLLTNRLLVALVIMVIIANGGVGALGGLTSGFFLSNLHGTSLNQLGYIPAASGAGMLLGAVLAGGLSTVVPLRFIMAGSVLAVGLMVLLLAFQQNLTIAVIIVGFDGIFNGMIAVSVQALLARLVPRTLIGRVASSAGAISSISIVVATLVVAGVVGGGATSHGLKQPATLYTSIFVVAALVTVAGGIVGLLLVLRAPEEPR